jgi:hypothetical protein
MSNPPGQPRLPLQGNIVSEPAGDGPRQPLHGEVVPGSPSTSPVTLELLDLVSFLMDRLVQVPGTNVRVGLNALLLFLPVIGDIVQGLVSFGILSIGLSNYRVPRSVAARMLFNSLLDVSLGWIPVLGDLFDVYFKADTRNVRLLQQFAGRGSQQPPSTWRHWLFVLGLLGIFIFVVGLVILGAAALIHWIVGLFRGGV